MSIVQVALPIPLDRTFDYCLPHAEAVCIGARVKVPFGRRHLYGIVTQCSATSTLDPQQLKSITQILDQQSLFSDALWQVLQWAAHYYHFPLGEVLQHALPVLLRQGEPAEYKPLAGWQITASGEAAILSRPSNKSKQHKALVLLRQKRLYAYQLKELMISRSTLNALTQKGLIEPISEMPTPQQWQYLPLVSTQKVALNSEQSKAIEAIQHDLDHFIPWLLEGVTGSGKTEVYLSAIESVLALGKQVLVLVPEIGLTPQTIARFHQRFTVPIEVLHSSLTKTERLTVWLKARNKESAIIIGTRSALFTPFANLGMIIIDEEHDSSYKQQEGWRYHARDVAVMRAKVENIPIIMGSATPALESLHNVAIGKYHHVTLTERAGPALPVIPHLVDIKGHVLSAGLSPIVIDRIKHHLAANNQVMIFLNRRGFSPAILCHECGWISECQRCNRPYTLHKQLRQISCHHCGSQRPIPVQCKQCGSTQLQTLGVGTEQLEQSLQHYFPATPITRIDRDTTSRKGALEHYLAEIHQGGARILIGTQMLAKGHHFADVTLVALVDVDGALFSADFRATERFAQLYTQVAGRAGREIKQGEVLLQTHYPDHPLLHLLLHQGYQAFSQYALTERQMIGLPPYSFQAILRAEAHHSEKAEQFLAHAATLLHPFTQHTTPLRLLGPLPAVQAKRSGRFRWQLIVQHTSRQFLQHTLHTLYQSLSTVPSRSKVQWHLDIDPIDS